MPEAINANRSASVPLPTPHRIAIRRTERSLLRIPDHRTADESCGTESRFEDVDELILQLPMDCHEIKKWNFSSLIFVSSFDVPQHSPRISYHDRVRGDIACHDAAGADQCIFADHHVREDGCSRSD